MHRNLKISLALLRLSRHLCRWFCSPLKSNIHALNMMTLEMCVRSTRCRHEEAYWSCCWGTAWRGSRSSECWIFFGIQDVLNSSYKRQSRRVQKVALWPQGVPKATRRAIVQWVVVHMMKLFAPWERGNEGIALHDHLAEFFWMELATSSGPVEASRKHITLCILHTVLCIM